VASVSSGSTGILFDQKGLIEYLKKGIQEANRSLRLVVPTTDFLRENNLLELIQNLPENCVVNIATAFDLTHDIELIDKWKQRKFYLTEYSERNITTISTNGADIGVAFTQGDSISGFFTNIAILVTIFNQAAMHAFVKGKKL
jgi:hypothetical protein